MVYAVLLFLKILLIVLAVLLGLIVLVLCLVLFLPVRYRVVAGIHDVQHTDVAGLKDKNADDEKNGKNIRLNCRIRWLLGFVRGFIRFDGKLEYALKVAWFGIVSSEPSKKKEKKKRTNRDNKRDKREETSAHIAGQCISEEIPTVEKMKEPAKKTDGQSAELEVVEPTRPAESGETSPTNGVWQDDFEDVDTAPDLQQDMPEKPPKVKFWTRLKRLFVLSIRKIKSFFMAARNILYGSKNGLLAAKDKIIRLYDAVTDEENHEMVRFLWRELKFLLKKIAPKKYDISIIYGADSPDVTGKVTGGVAAFRGFINCRNSRRKRFSYQPVFTGSALDADCDMKGSIMVWSLAMAAFRVYRNPGVRKFLDK